MPVTDRPIHNYPSIENGKLKILRLVYTYNSNTPADITLD